MADVWKLPTICRTECQESLLGIFTLSPLCGNSTGKKWEKCIKTREGKKEGQRKKAEDLTHLRSDWHSSISVCRHCCQAWRLACRLSHLPGDLEVTLDMLYCFCPSLTWLTLLAVAITFIFLSSGLLKIFTGHITLLQEMFPLFDHSKIIVSDFSIMSMFSLPPVAPPNHSKVTHALKTGFIFRGLFSSFFRSLNIFPFDTHGRLFPPWPSLHLGTVTLSFWTSAHCLVSQWGLFYLPSPCCTQPW